MPPFSSKAFPFLYSCQCGALELADQTDDERARYAADAALLEIYRWTAARPDSICPDCADNE